MVLKKKLLATKLYYYWSSVSNLFYNPWVVKFNGGGVTS